MACRASMNRACLTTSGPGTVWQGDASEQFSMIGSKADLELMYSCDCPPELQTHLSNLSHSLCTTLPTAKAYLSEVGRWKL